ncbi:hypothetical protein J6P92_06210 [bacterium]|nr:hypothetical protein [bacterium]
MIIKKLTITPVNNHCQKEMHRNLDTYTAKRLIKGRLYNANGYDTKIPKRVLIKAIGKDLQRRFNINPETLVLPPQRFVYDM